MVLEQRGSELSFFWQKEFEREALTRISAHTSLGLLVRNSLRVCHFLMNSPSLGNQSDLFINFDLRLHTLRSILTISALYNAETNELRKSLTATCRFLEDRTASICAGAPEELQSYLSIKNALAHSIFVGSREEGRNQATVAKAVGHCLARWRRSESRPTKTTQFSHDLAVFEKSRSMEKVYQRELFVSKEPSKLLGFNGNPYPEIFSRYEFEYWREWYLGYLTGSNIDWKLQQEVALISDEVWDQGPSAVALAIEEIKAQKLQDRLPQAETIDIDPETGLFTATPVPVQNTPLMGTFLSRVADSLGDALQGNNALNDRSREVKVLERTLSRYSNDPQRIEMDFTSIAVGLRRQLNDTRDLPQSEDNLALLEAVEDAVKGIRAAHPDVAENRITLAQQAMKELPPDQIDLLEDAKPVLIAMSQGRLAEGFSDDIPELINDALLPLPSGAPPLPGADVSTRIFSRVSSMRLNYDKFIETGAKVFDSKTFKTARLGLTLCGMLSALVSLGLMLFGVL